MTMSADEIKQTERKMEVANQRADQAAIEIIHAVLPRVTRLSARLSGVRDSLALACDDQVGWHAAEPGRRAVALRTYGEELDAAIDCLKSVMVMINASQEDDS